MPGAVCAFEQCKNSFEKAKKEERNLRFFRFPKKFEVRKKWIAKCHRQDPFDPNNKRICSDHFTEDDFEDLVHANLTNTLPRKLKPTGNLIT